MFEFWISEPAASSINKLIFIFPEKGKRRKVFEVAKVKVLRLTRH